MACIYVCDDDKSLLQFLKDVLESAGHAVHTAHDLSSFRFLVLGGVPDLAIVDIDFAGGGGPAAAALLAPRIPVIVLSGLSTAEQMRKFQGRLDVRFLEKPVDLGLLECAVAAMLPGAASAKQRGH